MALKRRRDGRGQLRDFMKLHLNNRPDGLTVQSCELAPADDGGARHRFKIDGVWYQRSVILTPEAVALWEIDAAENLTAAHFERLADYRAEVVLLGSGARRASVPAALTQALMRRRIGLEIMDTAAACRTYNILAGDARPVVAALIA